MSINVIYNQDILSYMLFFLPIKDIMNFPKLSKTFYELMNKKSNIWKILEPYHLNSGITSRFNSTYDVLQKISWGTDMCCSLCGKKLPLKNIALLICDCSFHYSRNAIYLKYHSKCLFPYIKNTMRHGNYNREKNPTFLSYCPICKNDVLGLYCTLY